MALIISENHPPGVHKSPHQHQPRTLGTGQVVHAGRRDQEQRSCETWGCKLYIAMKNGVLKARHAEPPGTADAGDQAAQEAPVGIFSNAEDR